MRSPFSHILIMLWPTKFSKKRKVIQAVYGNRKGHINSFFFL